MLFMFTHSISGSEVRLQVWMISESEIKSSVSHSTFFMDCVTFSGTDGVAAAAPLSSGGEQLEVEHCHRVAW